MIRYDLICDQGHGFDAWFRDSSGFEEQAAGGELACPVCGSGEIGKALMAPRLSRGLAAPEPNPSAEAGVDRPLAPDPREKAFRDFLANLRRHVTENADYVGPRFAEEARRMHYREADRRDVYGEASLEEAKALFEEGIEVMPLPDWPEERN